MPLVVALYLIAKKGVSICAKPEAGNTGSSFRQFLPGGFAEQQPHSIASHSRAARPMA